MLTEINPKLPMRNKAITQDYYVNKLGFEVLGNTNYDDYLMVQRDRVQIHFFLFAELNPNDNYGMVYIRTLDIDVLYKSFLQNQVPIHPNGPLQSKPWGQREFAVLDPDKNLLTFGQSTEDE